jgi:hypothetical protein
VFEISLDAWYAWVGVGLVSIAVFGLVLSLPSSVPPDAATVGDTIDRVASSPHEPRETIELTGEQIRITPHQIGLRTDGGSEHATLAYGPVTPVESGPLRSVIDGKRPREVFETEADFAAAIDRATDRIDWRPAPERLVVTRVSWGETDATLVG